MISESPKIKIHILFVYIFPEKSIFDPPVSFISHEVLCIDSHYFTGFKHLHNFTINLLKTC